MSCREWVMSSRYRYKYTLTSKSTFMIKSRGYATSRK